MPIFQPVSALFGISVVLLFFLYWKEYIKVVAKGKNTCLADRWPTNYGISCAATLLELRLAASSASACPRWSALDAAAASVLSHAFMMFQGHQKYFIFLNIFL